MATPAADPSASVAALRETLTRIAPAALPAFTRELAQADRAAGPAPLQRFIAQWAAYVHLHRHPQLAARLHELETLAAEGDVRQARKAASAIGHLLDEAHAPQGPTGA